MPYGGAPEWGHTTGNGLSGTLPTGIDPEWTIAGFVRLEAGSVGSRHAWFAGAGSRRLRISADGSISCRFGAGTLTAAARTITDDTWHHVALRRTATARELWVDGAMVDSQTGGGETLNSRTWTMAVAVGGDAVALALDEWGIWAEAIDVAALYARRTHHRAFGGYVYGVGGLAPTSGQLTSMFSRSRSPATGLRLDHSYVRQIYASVQAGLRFGRLSRDVLELAEPRRRVHQPRSRAGRHDHPRRLPGPKSVMTILRELADLHGAIVTVDEWLEIDLVRRTNLESSPLVLNVAGVHRQCAQHRTHAQSRASSPTGP